MVCIQKFQLLTYLQNIMIIITMKVSIFGGSISPSKVMQAVKTGLKPWEQLIMKDEQMKQTILWINSSRSKQAKQGRKNL